MIPPRMRVLFIVPLVLLTFVCIFQQKQTSNRGVVLWKNGQYDRAMELWKKQLAVKEQPVLYQKIIEGYISLGQYDDAGYWCSRALTKFPSYVSFTFYSATICFYRRQYEECLVLTDKVITENPYFPEVHALRGLVFEQTGKQNTAHEEFIKEVNNNPGSRLAWTKLQESRHEKD